RAVGCTGAESMSRRSFFLMRATGVKNSSCIPEYPVPTYTNKERGNMEFSTLYQELQYSTEMIRALLSGVAPQAARLKPSAESWSILEVVCHLYDEEREDFRE